MEKYSFLMSLYIKEKPEFLELSIQSMMQQTLMPDEIVIVKDGPVTDELQKILDIYERQYPDIFTVVGYEKNMGLAYALNYGLEVCRNELVARLDSDDYACAERCELQVAEFEKRPSLDLLGTGIRLFSEDPFHPGEKIKVYPRTKSEMNRIIRRDSAFAHVAVMFKKSRVIEAGAYDPDLRLAQDHDLFTRMIYKGYEMDNLPQLLVLVRADQNLKLRRKNKLSCDTRMIVQKRLLQRKQCSIFDYLYIWAGVTAVRIMPSKMFIWLYSVLKERRH